MQIDLVELERAPPGALMAATVAVEGFCLRRAETVAVTHNLGPTSALIFRTLCVAALASNGGPADMDDDTPLRWVSRTALAESCNLPRETVRRKCERLVRAGLIEGDRVRGVTPSRPALAAGLGPDSHDT
uniref:helix-turn-helix domain-containing protein n=2 Tax=Phenylobacterium aquaticum TaxID=1763816 RepID=UPI0026F22050